MTDTAVRADETVSPPPAHPLDPASAAEYLAGRDIMAAAGLLTEPVRFAYYGLEEPPKDEVLANTMLANRHRSPPACVPGQYRHRRVDRRGGVAYPRRSRQRAPSRPG